MKLEWWIYIKRNPVDCFLKSILQFAIATLLLGSTSVLGQMAGSDVKVTRLSAETKDSLTFQISVDKSEFRRGEDIIVRYAVTNKSNQTFYLVTEPETFVSIRDLWILQLEAPVKWYDAHDPYKYDLIKIDPKNTYKGKLIVPAAVILENKKYDFGIAGVQAGFSYISDISNLKGCKEATYTLTCLKELFDKTKNLTIGNLMVSCLKP